MVDGRQPLVRRKGQVTQDLGSKERVAHVRWMQDVVLCADATLAGRRHRQVKRLRLILALHAGADGVDGMDWSRG